MAKKPCSKVIYARFEVFIDNAESVTRIIFSWRIIANHKIIPNKLSRVTMPDF